MKVFLFVWTVHMSGYGHTVYHEWEQLADFSSYAACEKARINLNIQERSRCIRDSAE